MLSLAWLLLFGLALEAVLGWPDWLLRRIGHPVMWIGAVISASERRLNSGSDSRRLVTGGITVAATLILTAAIAIAVDRALPQTVAGDMVRIVIVASLLSARSLYDHVKAVAVPLSGGDMSAARSALSHTVGRNTESLDESAVARAAIETLAENSSDGVVAPVFWGLLFGLPGLAIYKAVNTLDSMIGYRSERYEQFGKIAARLDDLANLVPARMTALFFLVLVPARLARNAAVICSDAGKHRSPNAGWPESALAACLDVRLSGPRAYDGKINDEPWVNPQGRDPLADDVSRALRYYVAAMVVLAVILAIGGAVP